MEPIQSCIIPEYITKVPSSGKRQPTYFSKWKGQGVSREFRYDSEDLEGKYEPVKEESWAEQEDGEWVLPISKTRALKVVRGKWGWEKGYLVDEDGERVIANPRTAGTRSYEHLSGNRFTTGMPYQLRSKLVHGLKDFYRPFIQDQLEPIPEDQLPVRVEWICHTPVDGKNDFDLSNFWFYYKYFEDCLTETEDPDGNPVKQIIPDDSVRYVTQPGAPFIVPVDNWEDREFIFRFYSDTREVINTHPYWNGNHQPESVPG